MSFAASTSASNAVTWISTSSGTSATTIGSVMANAIYSSQHLTTTTTAPLVLAVQRMLGDCHIADGEACRVRLPDGAVLEVKADGSYRLDDANSKVVYRAHRVREFNSYLNASDKLEDFIRFCGEQGIRQDDVLGLPIQPFIAWLVIEAARADDDPEPDVLLLPDLRKAARPHCVSCGRFISPRLRAKKLEFCRAACFDRQLMIASAA